MARLVLDARERQLIKLFGSDVEVKTLDVGDIICEYEDGNSWIAERKTADDLARSIIDLVGPKSDETFVLLFWSLFSELFNVFCSFRIRFFSFSWSMWLCLFSFFVLAYCEPHQS